MMMMMKKKIVIVLVCALVSWNSHASDLQNFCKADLNAPDSPSGYHCLPPETVSAPDFKYSFNGKPGISVPTNALLYPASVEQMPITNGLGISAGLVRLQPGGSLPVHDHRASEILYAIKGVFIVVIMTPRKAYENTIKEGEFMVIPKTLPHFLINNGKGEAVGFAAYSSHSPSLRFQHLELFSNNVSTPNIARTTFLDEQQVRKLKARFNGTG